MLSKEWQSGHPENRGPYLVKTEFLIGIVYSYWNGKKWGISCSSKITAEKYKDSPASDQKQKWKELT